MDDGKLGVGVLTLHDQGQFGMTNDNLKNSFLQ